jgi:hypothetical protein
MRNMLRRVTHIKRIVNSHSYANTVGYYYYSDRKMQHSHGFVIDIDGTLVHHGMALEAGTTTLNYLSEHNIPFLLLTNNCHSS